MTQFWEKNDWLRKIEEEDNRRFCSVSIGILLTKLVADILQNLFLTDLANWETVHITIAGNIEEQRYGVICSLCHTMLQERMM